MKAKNLRTWSNMVLARDYYHCRLCGRNGCRLSAHHIEKRVEIPELSLDTDNGITLCPACHGEADSLHPFYQFSPSVLKKQIYKLPKTQLTKTVAITK